MHSVSPQDRFIPERRILWLSHFLPWPPKGGLHQRSYYLMRAVGRHHHLHVIAFRQLAHQPSPEAKEAAVAALSKFSTVRAVVDLPEDRRAGGRRALALRSLMPGPPYTIRWGASDEYADAVRRVLQDFRPEVVHFDTVSLSPYSQLLYGVPAVLNHHNIESKMLFRRAQLENNPVKSWYFWQEARRLAAYERKVARQFFSHVVCGPHEAERLTQIVGEVPTRVIPNGVDLAYHTLAPEGTQVEPRSLIFVGGMSWYPNLSAIRFFITRVWPELSRRHPETTLTVIGRDPARDLLAFSHRDPRVLFPGFVEDIRPLVHRSSIYICPIHDGGGTKVKMLDAMAMGKAIVAHPVACEGLHLVDGRTVLMAETPEDFLQAITLLFADVGLRKQLARSARRHVEEHFSFEVIGRRFAEYLGSVGPNESSLSPPST